MSPDLLDPVLFAVIDRLVRAQMLAKPAFIAGSRGRDDLQVPGLCELNGRGADTAGSAMHEQSFPGERVCAHEDVVPDSEISLRNRGGFRERHRLRYRNAMALVHAAIFGVASAVRQRHYTIAGFPALGARARRGDIAPRSRAPVAGLRPRAQDRGRAAAIRRVD